MAPIVVAAIVTLFVIGLALGGSRDVQRAVILMSSVVAAALLAIWYFLYS